MEPFVFSRKPIPFEESITKTRLRNLRQHAQKSEKLRLVLKDKQINLLPIRIITEWEGTDLLWNCKKPCPLQSTVFL